MLLNYNVIDNVGLFDERFCSIGYQEMDYFTRLVKYYKEKTSLNDYLYDFGNNSLKNEDIIIEKTLTGNMRNDEHHITIYHHINEKLYKDKIKNNMKQFVFYPYFETELKIYKNGDYYYK